MESSEQPKKDSGQKPAETGMSRREFLKQAAYLIGGGITAIKAVDYLKQFSEEEETEELAVDELEDSELERAIEKKYNINLIASYKGSGVSWDHRLESPRWDDATLKMLDQFLSYLPPHFYDSSGWGSWNRPLKIIRIAGVLGDATPAWCACGAVDKDTKAGDSIVVSRFIFNSERVKDSLRIIAHEFTHKVTHDRWRDEIERILGGNFTEVQDKLMKEAIDKRGGIRDNVSEDDKEKITFYRSIAGSLMNNKPENAKNELLAVTGEYYVLGKDQFYEAWQEFLKPDQVDRLYNFARTEIYQGKEYGPIPF